MQTNKSKRRKSDPAWAIYINSKDTDRKFKRQHDLTLDEIREIIKDGCSYCGETTIKMTIDRIDNSRGHLKDNVRPACIRCNYIRRDMMQFRDGMCWDCYGGDPGQ